jgi:FAD/FMN-containing dehydrogenase
MLVDSKMNKLIINGGRCPYVGISGFILGAGLGPFTRIFGMGGDTLLSATLVTAEGKRAEIKHGDSPTSDEGRLFWDIQGAGQANFRDLTEMKLKIQHLNSKDGNVVGGKFM